MYVSKRKIMFLQNFIGGILTGVGARIALGCNIGTLWSGFLMFSWAGVLFLPQGAQRAAPADQVTVEQLNTNVFLPQRAGGHAAREVKVEQARFMLEHDVKSFFSPQRLWGSGVSPDSGSSPISAPPRDMCTHASGMMSFTFFSHEGSKTRRFRHWAIRVITAFSCALRP